MILAEHPKTVDFLLPTRSKAEIRGNKLSDFTIGNFIAKGSYGAVFNATLKNSKSEPDFMVNNVEFDKNCKLAIKQMFNYSSISSESIFHNFHDEIVFNKGMVHTVWK